MHGLAPRVILGEVWWKKESQLAKRKYGYRCHACGIHASDAKYHKWLEGHEQYQIDYRLGRMVYIGTVALCHSCHSFIHQGRLKALLDSKKISKAKYRDILTHGIKLLSDIPRILPYVGLCAAWDKWRLVIGTLEYPPIYKNKTEWERHYLR